MHGVLKPWHQLVPSHAASRAEWQGIGKSIRVETLSAL